MARRPQPRSATPPYCADSLAAALQGHLHREGATKAFDFGHYNSIPISHAVRGASLVALRGFIETVLEVVPSGVVLFRDVKSIFKTLALACPELCKKHQAAETYAADRAERALCILSHLRRLQNRTRFTQATHKMSEGDASVLKELISKLESDASSSVSTTSTPPKKLSRIEELSLAAVGGVSKKNHTIARSVSKSQQSPKMATHKTAGRTEDSRGTWRNKGEEEDEEEEEEQEEEEEEQEEEEQEEEQEEEKEQEEEDTEDPPSTPQKKKQSGSTTHLDGCYSPFTAKCLRDAMMTSPVPPKKIHTNEAIFANRAKIATQRAQATAAAAAAKKKAKKKAAPKHVKQPLLKRPAASVPRVKAVRKKMEKKVQKDMQKKVQNKMQKKVHYSVEWSRSQVMCRVGRGPGSTQAIPFGKGGVNAARKLAEAWVKQRSR
jgi:hypothetical protein